MPAMNPSNTAATGNPTNGVFVMCSPFSGPKGSPKDTDSSNNASTGALMTGIGWGPLHIGATLNGTNLQTPIQQAGFAPSTLSLGNSFGPPINSGDARWGYIGGGRSNNNVNGVAAANPYTLGHQVHGFGGGSKRDWGTGPAYGGVNLTVFILPNAQAPLVPGGIPSSEIMNVGTATIQANEAYAGPTQVANNAPPS